VKGIPQGFHMEIDQELSRPISNSCVKGFLKGFHIAINPGISRPISN